jgi:hypothetical protein
MGIDAVCCSGRLHNYAQIQSTDPSLPPSSTSQARSPWYQKDIEVLEKVQKRAVSMIKGLSQDSYDGKLKELGLQSLKERREEADLIMAYKLLNGKLPVKSDNWPKLVNERGRDNPHVTRAAVDGLRFIQPFARTDRRKTFFTVRVCEQWNRLPPGLEKSKNVGQFKKNLRIFAASHSSEAMDNEREM